MLTTQAYIAVTQTMYPQPPGKECVYFDNCEQYATYFTNFCLETLIGFPRFQFIPWQYVCGLVYAHVFVGTTFTTLNVFSYFAPLLSSIRSATTANCGSTNSFMGDRAYVKDGPFM